MIIYIYIINCVYAYEFLCMCVCDSIMFFKFCMCSHFLESFEIKIFVSKDAQCSKTDFLVNEY